MLKLSLSVFPSHTVGYLISLKDPELALAIEVCLKGLLPAFTCDNHEDEKVLQGLMSRVFPPGRRPAIVTSHFLQYVHDTRKRWGHINYSWQSFLKAFLSSSQLWKQTLLVLKGSSFTWNNTSGHLKCSNRISSGLWCFLCQGSESSWIPLCASSSWNWGPSCGQLPNWSKGYREHSTHQGKLPHMKKIWGTRDLLLCNWSLRDLSDILNMHFVCDVILWSNTGYVIQQTAIQTFLPCFRFHYDATLKGENTLSVWVFSAEKIWWRYCFAEGLDFCWHLCVESHRGSESDAGQKPSSELYPGLF